MMQFEMIATGYGGVEGPRVDTRNLSSAKTQRHSCSAGQEAVLVVKSVQDGVCHNSA